MSRPRISSTKSGFPSALARISARSVEGSSACGRSPSTSSSLSASDRGAELDPHGRPFGSEVGVLPSRSWPGRRHQQEGTDRPNGHSLEHLDELAVSPVEVLTDEERRTAGGDCGHEPRPRPGELFTHFLRLHPVKRVVVHLDTCGGRECERGRAHLGIRETQGRQDRRGSLAKLVGRDRCGVVERDTEHRSEDLAERPICDPAAGGETSSLVDGELRSRGCCFFNELVEQPALPDPSGSDDDRGSGPACVDRLIEGALQRSELALAADQTGNEPPSSTGSAAVEVNPGHFIRSGPAFLPLEIERDRTLEAEGSSRDRSSPFAHEDRPRCSGLLEAGGDVHGVTGHDLLFELASDRRHHVPRVHADADLERFAETFCEVIVQVVEPLEHLDRRTDSSLRVVLVDGRDSECRQDRVADVLLDRAAPRIDYLGHGCEIPLKQRPQALWIESAAELRRPGQIGEQDRDEFPFLRLIGRSGE